MVTFEQRPMWDKAAILGWSAVAILLLWVVAAYSAYAADVVAYPFGLDYSEGLIWQQALWMGGPHMYGNISHYPFLVFEYPPLYHIIVRLSATSGLDMLETGRAVSVASAMIAAGCVGALVFRLCTGSGIRPAAFAAGIAAMLPFTLLPVIAWSPLMRVDMLATAFTFAGVWFAVESVRNPPVVYAAMLCFVAACLTKQTFVAAPAATLVVHAMRNPRLAARAGFAAAGLGLAIVGTLSWLTNGGFLRHILLYNINRFSLAAAMQQLIPWLIGYALYAVLVGGSIALAWRQASTKRRGNGWREWVRRDSDAAILLFLTVYFVFSTATLVLAGKSGASYNYFIEFFYLWCIWIGWLIGRSLPPPPAMSARRSACRSCWLFRSHPFLVRLKACMPRDCHRSAPGSGQPC